MPISSRPGWRDDEPVPDGGMPIRVVVADHHTMVAEAFCSALRSEPDIEVVGMAGTAAAAVAVICSGGDDIVVVADEDLPGGVDGPAAWILEHAPGARLVLLAERADPLSVQAAVDAGCVGYIMKSEDLQRLKDVVRAVSTGHLAVPVDALRSLFELRLSTLEDPSGRGPQSH